MKTLLQSSIPEIKISVQAMLFEYTEIKTLEDEVFLVTIKLQADKKQLPPVYKISWSEQAADIHALWHPGADRNKTFQADWAEAFSRRIHLWRLWSACTIWRGETVLLLRSPML